MQIYDIVVLGAGPGGYVAAIKAAQLGAKTAIIEKKYFGGTCLNVGCIPTKTLVKNAEMLYNIEKASKRGITVGKPEIDIKRTIAMKDMVVKQLSNGVHGLLKSHGIDIFNGRGTVQNDKTVEITYIDGSIEKIAFKKLIIATGSSNFIPPVEGLTEEGILTSTEILNLQEIPEHLLIIGGGVIGCEFATVFKAFGSKVTIVEMMPALIPNMDNAISLALQRSLIGKGIDVNVGSRVEKVNKSGSCYEVTVSKDGKIEIISADRVLVSVGRKPNTEGISNLELEKDKNYIKVNEKLETSMKGIYAIGDVTGQMLLAHVASAQGIRAVENALGNEKRMDLSVVPSCIYTIPEIGAVGITEEQAREKYGEILVGNFPLMACGKALAMGETEGVFKIIADKATRKVVGAHFFGANATEIIAEIAAYMKMGGTIDDIGSTIHAHPTISECVMEAVHEAEGHCIHLPKR